VEGKDMSGIEYGAGSRIPHRSSPFPSKWGTPPFELEARAGWISANLFADQLVAGRDTHVRALGPGTEPRRSRNINGRQARLALLAREAPPW